MSNQIDRRTFLRGAGAVGALSVAGGALPRLASTTGAGKKGGRIIEASLGDMQTFNFIIAQDVYSGNASQMIYDPLYMFDPSGNIKPCLAESMPTISNGGTTYTIKLNQKAKWTDGTPVTSADVKMTYDFIYAPQYAAVKYPSRTNAVKYIKSVDIVDTYTVAITTNFPYAPFMATYGVFQILPHSVYGSLSPAEINTAPANTKPTVTSGAFKNAVWTPGQQQTFQPNPDYFRGAPNIDEYVIKPSASSTNVINLLLSNEADFGQIDTSQVSAARANRNLSVSLEPRNEFVYAIFQLDPSKSQLFGDVRVRQALYWATDRQAIVKSIYFGEAAVANGPIPPVLKSWYEPHTNPNYTLNTGKANQLLDAAGFKKGSNGVRAKGGVKLAWDLIVPSTDQVEIQLATALQSQWKKVGVNITLKPADLTTVLVPDLVAGNFDMILLGEQTSLDPDSSTFWTTGSTSNFGKYSNPSLDTLMQQGVTTIDAAKRKPIYQKITNALLSDPACMFFVFPDAPEAVNKRILNFPRSQVVSRAYFINKLETTDGK